MMMMMTITIILKTQSQVECNEMTLTNYVSIIYGPPGCGKTTTIGLIVYNLLKNSNKKVLLLSQSNQAVENIVKFVSPVSKAMNKKLIWITKDGICFENREDFENATEEQKQTSSYKIMTRETEEAHEFYLLHQKKWKINEQRKQSLRNSSKKRYVFPMGCQNKINFEASQASQLVSLIPLIHNPSKLILIGDHKQLDASIPDGFEPTYPSTMKSMYLNLLEKDVQHVMLNTQFRMNRFISEFVNEEFYNGQIETIHQTEEETQIKLRNILTPIMFVDVKDGYESKVELGSTYKNVREADVIENILYNLKMNQISANNVGVITFYKGQVDILRKRPKNMKYNGVRISCVDSFQGTEKDFIILSLVRTNKDGEFGFITNL